MKKFTITILIILSMCISMAVYASSEPTGKYTGKFVMNPGQGEGRILVSDYGDATIKAHIKIEGPNGSMQISNANLHLKGNIAIKLDKKGRESLRLEFIEKSDIRGKKYMVVDFYYNGRPYGTFQRHHSFSMDIGPK